MKTFQYTYNFKPMIYDYIMRDEVGYCERTIQSRRKDIYNKTKDLMI